MSVALVTSPLFASVPGIVHGFTTRESGVSAMPYASLNLGGTGDERSAIESNRARVLLALNRPDATWVALKQVHGCDVVQVTRQASRSISADGLWTRDRSVVVAILVADCVPILFADMKGRAIGAVHAGWRGTAARITKQMVKRFEDAGVALADIRVAIGPAIGPDDFEIGPEVALELTTAFPEPRGAIRPGEGDRSFADLWALNKRALIEVGVAEANIDVIGISTVSDERFFSHRRDNGVTGRQAGVIAFAR
ncbi:MAG: peptidoglycan editing factor PgeF [Clostridia bacterium]|nr:peptidoglycan editing factor PgeF [Deltaproteobacteria bacterium]